MKVKYFHKYNLLKDYIKFDKFRSLRKEILSISKTEKNFYNGEYFYQSLPSINLSGLRDTKNRIEKIVTSKLLEGKSVLDIGTNIGSFLIELNSFFKKGTGIDLVKTNIQIGNLILKRLGINNINLINGDFNNYNFNEKFDVIFSLANHSTADKNIIDEKSYFKKIISLLKINGILVIESHHYLVQSHQEFKKIVEENCLEKFEILSTGKYDFGNFFDYNRIFYIMRLKNT
tara:strand:- start:270 stop:962 length:693 start_codon:yes stop_codon:yes gene_type:complete